MQPLADDTIDGFDIALFSAGGAHLPRVGASGSSTRGAIVVDNSSASGWTTTSRSSSPR